MEKLKGMFISGAAIADFPARESRQPLGVGFIKKQLEPNYDKNVGSCQKKVTKIRLCDVDSGVEFGDTNIDDDLDVCAEITGNNDDNSDEIVMDKGMKIKTAIISVTEKYLCNCTS